MQTQPGPAELADAASGPSASPVAWQGRLSQLLQQCKGPLTFAASFAFLNAVMNSRYPARQPALWYLLPSLDVVVVFVVFALFGGFGQRVPRALRGALVALFVLSRVLRIADGIEMGAYYRNFNVVVDTPLVPEFVRLFYSTVPHWRFFLACAVMIALLWLLGFLVSRAFDVAERALRSPGYARAFSLLALVFAAASPFEWQAPHEKGSPFKVEDDRRLAGAFGSSIFSRFSTELDFAANIYGYKAEKIAGIRQQQQKLATSELDLGKLAGKNVYLFLIESYGECVVERPLLADQVLPAYQRFEQELGEKGFQIASRVLDSSTYGGRSWLAHATISTGVRTTDQFQLELLRVTQPKTLAQAFNEAGYRTVLVQSATRRPSPLKDFHHFTNHYYTSDFGYVGPEFGWSAMPDQFVLDFVRRHELIAPKAPLFFEYALTSSHAPWSDLPPMIEDWSALGDGSIYAHEPGTHFANGWLELGGAADAYARSVVYDLDVLRRYIASYITDDSLVIILGDHQPHSEVTDQNPATGVPVHVLSKDAALIDPFRARGYTPGMRAQTSGTHPGLETFMTDLLFDFSSAKVGGKL
ncbi:MAG TPA: sulfatase-like hydrolase/transferase [Polyangiaceae bacterium]|jgi:threonine/homoserine/homoserine lactone efflux protein